MKRFRVYTFWRNSVSVLKECLRNAFLEISSKIARIIPQHFSAIDMQFRILPYLYRQRIALKDIPAQKGIIKICRRRISRKLLGVDINSNWLLLGSKEALPWGWTYLKVNGIFRRNSPLGNMLKLRKSVSDWILNTPLNSNDLKVYYSLLRRFKGMRLFHRDIYFLRCLSGK